MAAPGWGDDALKQLNGLASGGIAAHARARALDDDMTEPVQVVEISTVAKCEESFFVLAGDCIVSRAGLVAGQGVDSPSLLNDLAIAMNAAHERIRIE